MISAGHIWAVHSLLPARHCASAYVLMSPIVLNMAGHPLIDKGTQRIQSLPP